MRNHRLVVTFLFLGLVLALPMVARAQSKLPEVPPPSPLTALQQQIDVLKGRVNGLEARDAEQQAEIDALETENADQEARIA